MATNDVPNDGGVKTVEVWKGPLRDCREMDLRETGMVVTHRLTSTTASPVEYQVVDPFPGHVDVEDIGFHPNHEPTHGRIDGDQAVMSGVVGPDEEHVVTYGMRLASERPIEELETLQVEVLPVIERSKSVDPDDVDEADLETAAMARSAGATESADGDSVAFFDWLRRSIQRDEDADGSVSTGVEELERTDGPTADTAVEADADESAPDASGEPGGEQAVVSNDRGPAERSTAEALLHQLESDTLSDDQRRRLASALQELLATEETPRYSTEVRLRQLESKLQEFEAYADALGAIIDTHGPADEFLGSVRGDVTSLEAAVDDLRTELDRAAETRSSLDERLEAVADEVAMLGSRLERLDDTLESLRARHRTKVSMLEGRIAAIEPAADEVEDLSDAIASIGDEVEAVRSSHRAMVTALTEDEPDRS